MVQNNQSNKRKTRTDGNSFNTPSPFYSHGKKFNEEDLHSKQASDRVTLKADNDDSNTFMLEFISSSISTIACLVCLLLLGHPGLAVWVSVSVYFVTGQITRTVNNEMYRRRLIQGGFPQKSEVNIAAENIPKQDQEDLRDLYKMDWLTISKIPGVDAERLRNTFETFYKRKTLNHSIQDPDPDIAEKLYGPHSWWHSIMQYISKKKKVN